MSSDHVKVTEFTKENIDLFLKELAKEYRKLMGKKTPAEIVIIGGASVLINYNFRNSTTDIDAIIQAASGMKDAINTVGDRYCLPYEWLNADFEKTDSYSPKLLQFSRYYRTFSNVLTIRTISAEYLIAMKLRSGRQYKNDMSDILGILSEHNTAGQKITMGQITQAVSDLYGNWDVLPEISREFIDNAMKDERYKELYKSTREKEIESKKLLIQFEHDYPGVTKQDSVNNIIQNLRKKKGSL